MDIRTLKETSRRAADEIWNKGNLAHIDRTSAPSVIGHDPTVGDTKGTKAVKDLVATYRAAFPDLRYRVDDIFAEGSTVVSRWTAEGTHRGDLMGMPPTNRRAKVTGITIERYDENGRITETWSEWDRAGLLQQLGVAERVGAKPR